MSPSFFAISFLMQLTSRSQFLLNSLFLSSIHLNRSFRLGLLSSRFYKTPNISSITLRDVRRKKKEHEKLTSSGGVFQQLGVDGRTRKVNVSHD